MVDSEDFISHNPPSFLDEVVLRNALYYYLHPALLLVSGQLKKP